MFFVGKFPISILLVAVSDCLMEADWILRAETSTHYHFIQPELSPSTFLYESISKSYLVGSLYPSLIFIIGPKIIIYR